MAFYAGRIIREPAMENPTVVVLTDRNDLDDQLFGTFSRCQDLLRQPPVQAESRAHLRELLAGRRRRRGLHHHPEVLPGGEGRPASDALRAPQHRGDRRRGAPQPVRLHRRLRAAHARRAAPRLVHRLHRHADRAAGREHARRVRRLHQRLRHPARRAGRRHGADLLRKPPRQARARRSRAAEDRPGLRGGHRGRGGRAQGEAQDQVGAARGRRRRREAPEARRPGHRRALREAAGGDGRQGDGGVHEPAHLRRAVPRARAAAPRLAPRGRRTRRAQGGDDRLGLRSGGLAAAHPQQAAARGPGEPVPGRRRSAADRARARHVAHRLRRPRVCTRCTSTSRCAATG